MTSVEGLFKWVTGFPEECSPRIQLKVKAIALLLHFLPQSEMQPGLRAEERGEKQWQRGETHEAWRGVLLPGSSWAEESLDV